MLPGRHLLYHRGVDDHPGTYITDYIFAAVCGLLCIHLFIRIRREKKNLTEEQRDVTSCSRLGNVLPWNWPKNSATPVTMATYGVFLLGFSNFMMAILGGLTHQYLQTVISHFTKFTSSKVHIPEVIYLCRYSSKHKFPYFSLQRSETLNSCRY